MITSPVTVAVGARKQFLPNTGEMPFTGSINAIFILRFFDTKIGIVAASSGILTNFTLCTANCGKSL
jgi:hypothetical protein